MVKREVIKTTNCGFQPKYKPPKAGPTKPHSIWMDSAESAALSSFSFGILDFRTGVFTPLGPSVEKKPQLDLMKVLEL